MGKESIINELRGSFMGINEKELESLCDLIVKAPKIFMYGRGRVGIGLKGFCIHLSQLGLYCRMVGDITTPFISKGDILIVGSSLGFPSTIDRYIKVARDCGAYVAAFTSNQDGPLWKDSDVLINIHARAYTSHPEDFIKKELTPAEKRAVELLNISSEQPMCSTFEQLLFLAGDYLAFKLQNRLSRRAESVNGREEIMDELKNNLSAIDDGQIEKVIDQIEYAKRIFFSGRNREMLILSAFAMRVFHMGYEVYVNGEIHNPDIDTGDLLITSAGTRSQSGMESFFAQADAAKRAGAVIAAFTAHPEKIPKEFEYLVCIPGRTITAYEQVLFVVLDYTVKRMMERHKWKESDLSARHTNME